ncbi:hypothetical protein [Acidiphilium sp.]|uniref:hypothetical protein n=1 Tax=Acidiphilium sp. TaxID=527 RepID=UPI003D075168
MHICKKKFTPLYEVCRCNWFQIFGFGVAFVLAGCSTPQQNIHRDPFIGARAAALGLDWATTADLTRHSRAVFLWPLPSPVTVNSTIVPLEISVPPPEFKFQSRPYVQTGAQHIEFKKSE